MIKAFKYRIYPTKIQIEQIEATFNACRFVYNLALETKIYAWRQFGKNLSSYDLINQLPELKNDNIWLKKIDSQALQYSVKIIDISFVRLFTHNFGFPKFKKKLNRQSFQSSAIAQKIDFDKQLLTIPKIKYIPIVISRRFEGKIKTVTISRTPTGKYFASILVDNNIPLPETKPLADNAVGIDTGIKTLATLSNGTIIENNLYLRNSLQRLKVLQRRASRKKKDSNNRKKANLKVALLHEKISNQRQDYIQKSVNKILSDNQTGIIVEDLAIKNMIKSHKIAQRLNDVSLGEFYRILEYKCKWQGVPFVKIKRNFPSSKMCSNCGNIKESLLLSERVYNCECCGFSLDRDLNAAINIKNSGMGKPSEPVEKSAVVGSMK